MELAKKMAPRLRRGPAVELLHLQALQQGAGELIPVAVSKLGYIWGCCQGARLTKARF